jgi:predicted aminopeptidase
MSLSRKLGLVSLVLFLSACSPGYVMRAAYEQSKILLARRPIDQVVQDVATVDEDRRKLELVLEARAFAVSIGLDPKGSFTKYADIGKDTLAWVVMGSRKDSFNMYTWWFPIVGTVPYKGFFSQEDAINQAKELEQQGFETSVRGTEAFSTLGWFNDPLLSTTLKNPPVRIANTVIHESVHSTVWIKDNVPFNESLANFVASQATIEFFKARARSDSSAEAEGRGELVALAEREHRFTLEYADLVTSLYKELGDLYQRSDITTAQKIAMREGVFKAIVGPFKERYPGIRSLAQLNNAELLQTTIYMTKLRSFERLFSRFSGSWNGFFREISTISKRVSDGELRDPFGGL